MPLEKLSLDVTPPVVSDELRALRDSIELNNRKLEFYINLAQQTADTAIPVGGIIGLETTTAPVGYFLCNGGTFSGVDYPELAAYLGGTTLPNYMGRVLVGRDTGQVEFDTLGEVGGAKTATGDLAAHTHSHSHTVTIDGNNFDVGGGGGHFHTGHIGNIGYNYDWNHAHHDRGGFASEAPFEDYRAPGASVPVNIDTVANHGHNANHAHTGSSGTNAQSAGVGGGHNNLQPYRVVNWFIKA